MTDFYTPKKTKHDHWYKEPWMLLVLGGPLVVVIAAIITFYLAWQDSDNVLSRDYYRQGLNIDKDLSRDARAGEYKMRAEIRIDSSAAKVLLHLEGQTALPPSVQLVIASPSLTSEYEDVRKITLAQTSAGNYEGIIKIPATTEGTRQNVWHIKIEGADWRLTSVWQNPLLSTLQIKP